MYEKIKKIKNSLTLRSSNVTMTREKNNADVLASSSIQGINSLDHHYGLDRIVIMNRLSKLEEDTRILFEMLDNRASTIDIVIGRQNN